MSNHFRNEAEKLAKLPYKVEVAEDETTNGLSIYIARIPELEGCIAQGYAIEEAIENLRQAKIDYIESILQDGLTVPMPAVLAMATGSSTNATFTFSNQPGHTDDVKKTLPALLYEAALHTP